MKYIIKALKCLLIPFFDLILLFITYMPGGFGRKLRYFYWSKRLKSCGKNIIIDEGVIIHGAKWISIGDNVWIDKYAILQAGTVNLENSILKRANQHLYVREGELIIGNGVHIGLFNIIQAHGGVCIGDYVTTSAGVKIYSLSNYPYYDNDLSLITYANCMVPKDKPVAYIISPIIIEDNVWIGLNTCVLGGRIGKNSFISSNSIVLKDIPENSYVSGFPAKVIKNRFEYHE